MKKGMGSSKWFFLVVTAIFAFGLGAADAQAGDATVTLSILNAPNEQGEIIIAQGDPVEVEYQVIDPAGELSPWDVIRLRNIDDGRTVPSKREGKASSAGLSSEPGATLHWAI